MNWIARETKITSTEIFKRFVIKQPVIPLEILPRSELQSVWKYPKFQLEIKKIFLRVTRGFASVSIVQICFHSEPDISVCWYQRTSNLTGNIRPPLAIQTGEKKGWHQMLPRYHPNHGGAEWRWRRLLCMGEEWIKPLFGGTENLQGAGLQKDYPWVRIW